MSGGIMSAYLIIQSNIKDQAKLEKFLKQAIPIYGLYNARILAVDNNADLLEGDCKYKRTAIVEFDDQDKLIAWYQSMEYQDIKALRIEALESTLTYVHGVNHL